jgi:hypothetical protein
MPVGTTSLAHVLSIFPLHASASLITIFGTQFDGCYSPLNGGAIYISSTHSSSITDCTFRKPRHQTLPVECFMLRSDKVCFLAAVALRVKEVALGCRAESAQLHQYRFHCGAHAPEPLAAQGATLVSRSMVNGVYGH